jgi:phosphate transport system permease protein
MSVETSERPQGLRAKGWGRFADPAFRWLVTVSGTMVLIILALMVVRTTQEAWPIFQHEGFFGFLFGAEWSVGMARDEITGTYGAWPFIYGTLVTAGIAVVIALPLAIMVALYINYLAPKWLKNWLAYTVELLAAVPSVVFGLWGLWFFLPVVLRPTMEFLSANFGWFFLFDGQVYGPSYFSAGVVLAIMILPIITAIIREVFAAHPVDHQHAAYGIGATRFEVMTRVIIPSSFSGIVGAVMLGLGRALGETIAVLMLVGGSQRMDSSLLFPGDTMAAHIAATFQDAAPEGILGLMAIGVALFIVTMTINIIARLLVWRVGKLTGDAAV